MESAQLEVLCIIIAASGQHVCRVKRGWSLAALALPRRPPAARPVHARRAEVPTPGRSQHPQHPSARPAVPPPQCRAKAEAGQAQRQAAAATPRQAAPVAGPQARSQPLALPPLAWLLRPPALVPAEAGRLGLLQAPQLGRAAAVPPQVRLCGTAAAAAAQQAEAPPLPAALPPS